ncbi:MAG: hypothetical protein FWE44_04470 [Defluviitaleaceae bacterium]|nr:hypothetical protein [Defluviitaleaceae bacterium]
MKRTKFLGFALVVVAALMVFAACVYEGDMISEDGLVNGLPTAIGATFTPGTYTIYVPEADVASQSWRRGGMTVEVDFTANQIADIRVVSHGESMYSSMYFFRAYPMVPDYILVQQSTNNLRIDRSQPTHHQAVHTFTGGTATQEIIVEAVDRAIIAAGANPTDLVPQERTTPLPGDRFVPGSHLVHVPGDSYVFINNQFFHVNDIPAAWPAWPLNDARFNVADVTNRASVPAGEARDAAVAQGGVRSNGESYWRYGMNAQMQGVWTGSEGQGPVVANRVVFHSPVMNRNQTALAGPTWAETTIGNGVVTLPANVVSLLTARYGTPNNIYYVLGQATPTGMWLLVNFGRDVFQIAEHHGGDGLGNAGGSPVSSGESLSGPRQAAPEGNIAHNLTGAMPPFAPENAVYGTLNIAQQSVNGSSSSQGLGGYWWMQVAHRTINDNQSTHLVQADTYAGATQSALAVRLGVELAMRLAGADPAAITPTPNPFFVEPQPNTPNALQFVAGRYYINVPGFGIINYGSDYMAVTLCREAIRYLGSADMNALRVGDGVTNPNAQTQAMWGEAGRPAWVNEWNRFRNEIMYSFARTYANGGRQLSALDIAPMEGNVELSNAILYALNQLLTEQSYNFGNIDQTGRLGVEITPLTGNDNLNNRYNWR